MKKLILVCFMMMPLMAFCQNEAFGFKLGASYKEIYKILKNEDGRVPQVIHEEKGNIWLSNYSLDNTDYKIVWFLFKGKKGESTLYAVRGGVECDKNKIDGLFIDDSEYFISDKGYDDINKERYENNGKRINYYVKGNLLGTSSCTLEPRENGKYLYITEIQLASNELIQKVKNAIMQYQSK